MVAAVKINGSDAQLGFGPGTRFTELVELIKAFIDPEHIITDLRIDGRDVSDAAWGSTLSQIGTVIVEVDTGPVAEYVRTKMAVAPALLNDLYMQFRSARKLFQTGSAFQGNQELAKAVNTARAFFEWYATMLQLVPTEERSQYDIEKQVTDIGESCKKICQQQLYQSWSSVGETIEKEIEPKIDTLESYCRRFIPPAKAA